MSRTSSDSGRSRGTPSGMDDPGKADPLGWTPSSRRLLVLFVGASGAALLWGGGRTGGPGLETVPTLVVDPNNAEPGVLLALPRFGPTIVGRIVQERAQRPFESLFELRTRVRGIGPVTIDALEPFLQIAPSLDAMDPWPSDPFDVDQNPFGADPVLSKVQHD